MIPPTPQSPGIAAGTYDEYLRTYADSVRDFGHAVVIGFGHEMNAPWYSWGYNRVPATTFVAAWRHIVTLFKNEGADNVTWLWTINQDTHGTGPIAAWWPGKAYVTWVGIDGFYLRQSDTFTSVFGPTIRQVRKFTDKPILLSETAVGPSADPLGNITNLFSGLAQYKTLGLVWFDFPKDHGVRPAGLADRRQCACRKRLQAGRGRLEPRPAVTGRRAPVCLKDLIGVLYAEMRAQRAQDRDLALDQHLRRPARGSSTRRGPARETP